jgi:thiamine pyrophosphokinase
VAGVPSGSGRMEGPTGQVVKKRADSASKDNGARVLLAYSRSPAYLCGPFDAISDRL